MRLRIFKRTISKLAVSILKHRPATIATLIVVIVLAGSVSSLYFFDFKNPQLLGVKTKTAAITGATLTLAPSKYTVGAADQFSVTVFLNTGTNVAGQPNRVFSVGSYISFDPKLMSVVSVDTVPATTSFDFVLESNTDGAMGRFDNTRGKIRITASEPKAALSGAGIAIAKITFKALKPGTATLSFDFTAPRASNSKVVIMDDATPTDILDSAKGATYTIIDKKTLRVQKKR